MIRREVLFHNEGKDLILTQVLPDGEKVARKVNVEEISKIEKLCTSPWHQLISTSQGVGEALFDLLNGDTQFLATALKEAEAHDEKLSLFISGDLDLPFELLYSSQFLVPHKIHLVRMVSDYACEKKLIPQNRPLKILFVACSPTDASPVLEFEKEEERILDITQNLPVDIDVEDTGSLQGLKDMLEYEAYDIIHFTGHADIDEEGPYFCMEDEEGFLEKVTPSQLWETLNGALALPRLVFLSGCRTGQTPHAAFSFAHNLVLEHGPPVVGWGLPVPDSAATKAAEKLYHELGRGRSIADAVFMTRQELYKENLPDWCLLRLFSDGTDLAVPLVETGQQQKPRQREIQYTYLEESQVRVLTKGFIGRRRQIQKGIRTLKKDREKVGVLLHGTGGLGKSCLAGKLCERFGKHHLVIVHGELNAVTFGEALRTRFVQENDKKGLEILEEKKEMVDKINVLCSSSFKEKNYLILLDDFEKNVEGAEKGHPLVCEAATPILEALLSYLPHAGKMSQAIITSRYTFPCTVKGEDVVEKRLESIGLTSFQGADERKKVHELPHISTYDNSEVRETLIEAGRGNPRLMEILDTLVGAEKALDITSLLARVRGELDEFVQKLLLKEIVQRQSSDVQRVVRRSAVYGLPVMREGIGLVCEGLKDWQSSVEAGVQLSLIEEDRGRITYYWVTPLLREGIFEELGEEERTWCHKAAVVYWRKVLSLVEGYEPLYGVELIDHALKCGMENSAVEEGGRLLYYLRNSLAYREALREGEFIHAQVSVFRRDEKSSRFLFELGWIHYDCGGPRKAIEYFEQALSIDREVYGERHPDVATRLNNLGLAWNALGDPRKAIEYYEQALSIDREVYGERHPDVATMLNNLGSAWNALGNVRKATECFEQAYLIFQQSFGDKHPHTRIAKEWLDSLKKQK